MPIGAMLCKDKFNVFGPGDHASTYGGNPLACAAGLAVTSVYDKEGLVENTYKRGEQLRALAMEVKTRFPSIIKEVRGLGLINGIELEADCGITSADVSKVLLANGLLVVPAGPKVVRFLPPLIVTEAEIVEAMRRFEAALVEIQAANAAKAAAASVVPPVTPVKADSPLNMVASFFGKLFSSV